MIRLSALMVATMVGLASAHAAEQPWPGDRWRADVTEVRDGRTLHTTLVGIETHTDRGTQVIMTCSMAGKTFLGTTYATMRQDDFEGGATGMGEFSIYFPGTSLTWLDGGSMCASGNIVWRKM